MGFRMEMGFWIENSWTCGYPEKLDAVAFPERYNLSHCLNVINLASKPECQKLFGKMFRELQCLKGVKEHFVHLDEQSEEIPCHCPESCDSFSFETYYSLASWPGEGPEIEAAYQNLVLNKMINDFNDTGYYDDLLVPWWADENASDYTGKIFKDPWVSKRIIAYLSNPDNKKEILKDFTRVTVYVKDLTVETTEDVAEYPWESLLSDIGMWLNGFHKNLPTHWIKPHPKIKNAT